MGWVLTHYSPQNRHREEDLDAQREDPAQNLHQITAASDFLGGRKRSLSLRSSLLVSAIARHHISMTMLPDGLDKKARGRSNKLTKASRPAVWMSSASVVLKTGKSHDLLRTSALRALTGHITSYAVYAESLLGMRSSGSKLKVPTTDDGCHQSANQAG